MAASRLWQSWARTCAALLLAAVALQAGAAAPQATYQETINALTKASLAVVGVQVTAAEGARSAALGLRTCQTCNHAVACRSLTCNHAVSR